MNEVSWTLSDRQVCDCEMLLNGSFEPLNGFMNEDDYKSVVESMRLLNGNLFPMPIVLDISESFSKRLSVGQEIILRNKEGFRIATLSVESIWKPDFIWESKLVYGTNDQSHPGVKYLNTIGGTIYVGGKIEKISLPFHYDFKKYRLTPIQAKSIFKKKNWKNIIAFQTRNPIHRAHFEMTEKAMRDLKANLFLHPVVGITKEGDIDYYTRVRCYQHIIKKYINGKAILGILPLAMRMGGPREALLHAIIRKNYGCTHFIIGRDHAGPGLSTKGSSFYQPYEAQELVLKYQEEIGIKMVPFKFMVYVPNQKLYKPLDDLKKGIEYKTISGTKLRGILDNGEEIPNWFSFPDVTLELKKSIPPLKKRGFTIFFTGLSGSGKSTIANGIMIKLLEKQERKVTLLDGDIVRTHLSSELGFSKSHRSLNVQRIGFVASEITKNGGIAICAPIAPYEEDRRFNRELISKYGSYIEIFVDTPIEQCEKRDPKGFYKMARSGEIKNFTGISDPYEKPISPEMIINCDGSKTPEILVDQIFQNLLNMGHL